MLGDNFKTNKITIQEPSDKKKLFISCIRLKILLILKMSVTWITILGQKQLGLTVLLELWYD